ncbi:MAG: SIMPL domain-containing protein [Paracoccaceae bacterium]|nr:SIMPL domain-containing protein [Paracoccaceae bacterium]
MRILPKSLLGGLYLATVFFLPMAGVAMAEDPARITVTGEGRADARPDMAAITLGVTTEGATAAEAMTANSTELARVLANLRAAGIADRDLQTTGLSLNPNWDNSYGSNDGAAPKIRGYIASNMLTVRVRALDNLGAVLDVAVKDGANSLNGVSFGVTDPAPLLDEARKRAVGDALHRAQLLTEAAGARLGKLASISEGGGYAAPAPMFRKETAIAADAVPVAEGEVSMTVSVTITWEIAQ